MNKIGVVLLTIATLLAVGDAISPLRMHIRPIRPQRQQVREGANFCQGCRSMVSFMSNFNSSTQRTSAKDALKSYCELYLPVSNNFRQGPCPMIVESFFYIMGQVDPVEHCDSIGACGPVAKPTVVGHENEMIGDGVACDVCEQVVTQVQGMLEDPKLIEMIHQQVDGICEYLVVIGQSKQCRQMVDSYIDQAVDFVKHMNPLNYCQSVGICSAGKEAMLTQSRQKVFTLADFHGFGLETKVTLGDKVVKDIDRHEVARPISSVRARKLEGGPNCQFCKVFVKEMFKFLKDNRTEENVREGLDKVCELVYGKNQAKLSHCEMMVASYSREFVQLLVEETDPELICMLLDQCSYQTPKQLPAPLSPKMPPQQQQQPHSWSDVISLRPVEPVDMNTFVSMLDSDIQLGSTRTCLECKLFIEYLQNQIKDPKSQQEIKDWLLTNLCASLEEKNLKESCNQMVENYAEVFFKAVSSELSPTQTCRELNACKKKKLVPLILDNASSTRVVAQVKPAPKQASNVVPTPQGLVNSVCDQCVDIVTQLDEYLASHSVDHDFSVLIDQVCNKLPSDSMKQECTLLVKTFGEEIAQAISTMDNPKQLCSKIYLC